MQRALLRYKDPANRSLVIEALHKAGREDLIGFGPKCLVRPSAAGAAKSEARPQRKRGAGKEERPFEKTLRRKASPQRKPDKIFTGK